MEVTGFSGGYSDFRMMMELTTASAQEYGKIRAGSMTPAMAGEYLREGRLQIRTFSEVLRRFYPAADLQARLTAALTADNPSAAPASVSKNVRNWLSGRNTPSSRTEIFHIAFALSLTESEADYLLAFCTDCGIHSREGRDAVYAWFLRSGRSFREAEAFYATLPPAPRLTRLSPDDSTGEQITLQLRQAFAQVQTEEELRACYLGSLERFGELHLQAYHYFTRFMKKLMQPDAAWNGEKEAAYTLDQVMKKYLTLHMPCRKRRKAYSLTKRLIRAGWPSTTHLYDIYHRREDVSRKLLLLLYVVTENLVDEEYCEMHETYITMQERLDDHWYCLNAILADCGMALLDPRQPFDWLVLYALSADNEPMSARMEQTIDALFADET